MVRQTHDASFLVSLPTLRTAAAPAPAPAKKIKVQVRICHTDPAVWHRPMIDPTRARTECDKAIPGYYMYRPESYEGDLCTDGCFSPFVLSVAAEMRDAELERRRAEDAKLEAEREERAREWERNRAEAIERVRRFKTGQTDTDDPTKDDE